MAIDSAVKRASAIMLSLPFRGRLPLPDGAISAADRAEIVFLYRPDGVIPPPPIQPVDTHDGIDSFVEHQRAIDERERKKREAREELAAQVRKAFRRVNGIPDDAPAPVVAAALPETHKAVRAVARQIQPSIDVTGVRTSLVSVERALDDYIAYLQRVDDDDEEDVELLLLTQ